MNIEKRVQKGSKIRQDGLIPGILYGSGIESTPIQASLEDFRKEFNKNGYTKTFKVKLGKETHIVYIKDTQPEHMNFHTKIHFDLVKVAADDTMTAKVYVKYLNKDDVKKRALVIQSVLDEVEVEYQVGYGISNLEVDVAGLEERDSIKAGDIALPEGVSLVTDPEDTVLVITARVEYDPEAEETEEEPFEDVKEVESIKQSNE